MIHWSSGNFFTNFVTKHSGRTFANRDVMIFYFETFKSIVAIRIRLQAGKSINRVSIPGKGQRYFSSVQTFQTGCGENQPTFQQVPGPFYMARPGKRGYQNDHSPPFLPRLRMNGDVPPLSHKPTCPAETIYIYVYLFFCAMRSTTSNRG
jgi:hypothetical protein